MRKTAMRIICSSKPLTWVLTKIHLRIPWFATFVCSSFSQEIIQLSKVAIHASTSKERLGVYVQQQLRSWYKQLTILQKFEWLHDPTSNIPPRLFVRLFAICNLEIASVSGSIIWCAATNSLCHSPPLGYATSLIAFPPFWPSYASQDSGGVAHGLSHA